MYICIEGNIGSGKSTLAKLLAVKLKAELVPERFEENPLLPLFYEDKKTYAFPLEYSFLIDRQKQLSQHFTKTKKWTVSDYSLEKCLLFAEINLKPKDFQFYKKHFLAIKKTIPEPDLVIYIHASTPQLLRNIKNRGREYEKNITSTYLNKITGLYKKKLVNKRGLPVYQFEISSYDQLNMSDMVNEILLKIKTEISKK